MVLSSIGDGDVQNGGIVCQCGVYNGSKASYLDRVFVGLHSLLHVRIIHHACGRFTTRAVDLCGYLYDLLLCEEIVFIF